MKTTTKKLSDTRVEVKVVLDAADMQKVRQQALERLAVNLKPQGFRKGKVPAAMVPKYVSENDINTEVADLTVRGTLQAAFDDAKIMPIAIEHVKLDKFVPGESAEYYATAEVLPDVKLGDFRNLKATRQSTEPTAKEVQEIIDNIVDAYAEKVVVQRAAKKGDEVIIDFIGKKDGEAFKGGSAKDYPLVLGSRNFIPGFEDGIIGHASGDKFDLELTFPKDYGEKSLAGQKTVFTVLVKQVNEIKKPKEDDELAKKCKFNTMAELREDVKKNLAKQNEYRANEAYREELVAELVKNSKVAAPDLLISDQLRFIKDDMRRNAAGYGMQLEEYIERAGQKYDEWEKEARKVAEQRVKSSLVLQILARDQKIEATDAEVSAKVAELKDLYQKSKEALENLKKPEVRQDIKNRLIIDKTLDFLVAENEKNTKPTKKSAKAAKSDKAEKSDKSEKKPATKQK